MQPGNKFEKIWKMKNIGTVPFPEGTRLMFCGGDSLEGPALEGVSIPSVAVGEEFDIKINLIVPETAGRYRGNWRLMDNKGKYFGDFIWVAIVVPTSQSKIQNIFTTQLIQPIIEQPKLIQPIIEQPKVILPEKVNEIISQPVVVEEESHSEKSDDEHEYVKVENPPSQTKPIITKLQLLVPEMKPVVEAKVEVQPVVEVKRPVVVEIKPPVVAEIKPPVVLEIKPVVAEIKPPVVVEVKPPVVAEIKPVVAEIKPVVAEIKPVVLEIKPPVVETKPPVVAEIKPPVVETKPIVVEIKPIVDAKSPVAVVADKVPEVKSLETKIPPLEIKPIQAVKPINEEKKDTPKAETINWTSALTQLSDMGFRDVKQNIALLKKHRGDIEKAISELVTNSKV